MSNAAEKAVPSGTVAVACRSAEEMADALERAAVEQAVKRANAERLVAYLLEENAELRLQLAEAHAALELATRGRS